MNDDKMILFGVIELQEAKRIKSRLAEKKIALELVSNPETCSNGKCGPSSVEVYVHEDNAQAVKAFLEQERGRLLEGLDARDSTNDVFDSEKDNANCPACGTEFSTKLTECPECGLGFAVSE